MVDLIGQQLGHYRLINQLGHGGFADVYLGEHIHLGTYAAIKILDTHLSHDEIEPFRNEARTIAHLEHPHIVRVLDFGVEDQRPFLVMAYASHGTLRLRHPRGSRVAPTMIVQYVQQIASALQYAHDARVIHRDIKPENMLLGRNDELLLSDFGLAVIARSSSSQEIIRDVSGTVTYMAPEQARGKPRPASDQYALGIVVYEWLCGKRPFNGSYQEVAVQQVLMQPPPLRPQVPELSTAIEKVVLKALSKDPYQRYASIREFADAFEQACQQSDRSSGQENRATIAIETTESQQISDPLPSLTPTTPATAERSASDTIYTVAWSPDGKHLAFGGRDRAVQVRGTTTGLCTSTYREHNGSVTFVAWSPDGQKIASASLDKTIQVWQVPGGKRIALYNGHTEMIYTLAWSPNSARIASTSSGGPDNTVHVWDASNGNNLLTYRGHSYWIRSLAWSPDGKQIASGSWHEVQLWESATGKKGIAYRNHTSWIRAVAWSPDGTRVASASEDKTVHVWEINKGRTLAIHKNHNDWVSSVAWSPDGTRIASTSKDNNVHIWDTATGNTVSTGRCHPSSAHALLWLADGRHLVCANGDGSVQVWQIP